MSGRPTASNGAGDAPKGTRQCVQFVFYKVDPAWRALPADERAAAADEVQAVVDAMSDRMVVRPYSLVGIRGDADFMFWHIAETIAPFQEAATRLLATRLGPYLTTPHAFLAMTRRSQYVDKTEPGADGGRRLTIAPGGSKYLFVYPFVKTRPWYNLAQEKRQEMMDTHIRIGRKYPSVKLNTTYSFGLDDQEFVVSFETDEPADFLDLVMELRETESSLYTLRDTPTFTCVATTVPALMASLGATGTAPASSAGGAGAEGGWSRVCALSELAPGASKTAYVAGEQVAVFNAEGTLYAIEARCPHANAQLAEEGTLDGTVLTCTRHGTQSDLARDGALLRGPGGRPPVV
ncbi:MAG TPA: chlorite dismutase family protein, partial [Dehalococcoidia bacterium]|nr:chlorite dismutase family protein [Dehalococcoidia bacterium]